MALLIQTKLLRSHSIIMLNCSSEVTVSDANQEDRIQMIESNLILYLILTKKKKIKRK
jgi:hypothetical protein